MRVLSGRLKAVLVATLATIILVGVLAPGDHAAPATRPVWRASCTPSARSNPAATTPPGTRRPARTASTRSCRRAGASGRGRYLGDAEREADARPTRRSWRPASSEPSTPASSSWRRVAYWWLTGSSRTTGWSTYATRYVEQGDDAYRDGAGAEVAAPTPGTPRRRPRAELDASRYSEKSAKIAYSGDVEDRPAIRGYAGDAVDVRDDGRRHRDVHVHRHEGRLVRPGRADARQGQGPRSTATLRQDRRPATRARSRARKAVFSKSWSTAGAHTLVIEVVGTRGHPYVAIDELHGRRLAVTRAMTSISTRIVRGQGGHAHRRPGRGLRREVLAIDRVHRRELAEVAQVDRGT